MTPAERLEKAKLINHTLRFFREIEELAMAANEAENLLPVIEKRRAEIASLDGQIAKQKEQIDQKISSDGTAYSDFKNDLELKFGQLRTALSEKTRENELYLVELDQKKREADLEFRKEEGKRRVILADLNKEIDQKNATLSEINRNLAAIKSKI